MWDDKAWHYSSSIRNRVEFMAWQTTLWLVLGWCKGVRHKSDCTMTAKFQAWRMHNDLVKHGAHKETREYSLMAMLLVCVLKVFLLFFFCLFYFVLINLNSLDILICKIYSGWERDQDKWCILENYCHKVMVKIGRVDSNHPRILQILRRVVG